MQKNFTDLSAWDRLTHFKHEPCLFQQTLETEHLHVELHHQRLSSDALSLLRDCAIEQHLDIAMAEWAKDIYQQPINPSFTFLRHFKTSSLQAHQDAQDGRRLIDAYAEKIRNGKWFGYNGLPITDVVNIGMGGSDLGPRLCVDIFNSAKNTHLNFHFISDAEPFGFDYCVKNLNPATTLFLVSSKSFTTEETMSNAARAIAWVNHPKALQHHFIAITANIETAQELKYQHILPIWEWVVGRFSCCSAINLISALMLGYPGFESFLLGAHQMDQHFITMPWQNNLPLMMALIGIWNINVLKIPTQLMMVYASRLRHIVNYVQQMDMESNGKFYNRHDEKIEYPTGPIIWGGLGNQAHHSYYQLLGQGSHQIAIDFLSVAENDHALINNLCYSRKKILQHGIQSTTTAAMEIQQQMSINHIHLKSIHPAALGELIAMYEHKVFAQAWIWNLNPFNQPGVECAKKHFQY
jgi:glucose-6-phosphate isomerase